MHKFLTVTALIALLAPAAHAQSRSEWFKSLTVPNNGGSCCDQSDCKRTQAYFDKNDRQWHARIPDINGEYTVIPNDAILNNSPSYDGEAYICSLNMKIYCFVPPDPGT